MFDFIYANLEYFVSGIAFIITFIFSVINLCKTKNIKKFKEELNEMRTIYRSEHYVVGEDTTNKGQTFSEFKPVYKLNKATGELEKTEDKINIQSLINSAVDSALTNMLERFLPEIDDTSDVVQYNALTDDLDYMLDISARAEKWKEELGLDKNLSLSETFTAMSVKAEDLRKSLIEKANEKSLFQATAEKIKLETAEKVKADLETAEKVKADLNTAGDKNA